MSLVTLKRRNSNLFPSLMESFFNSDRIRIPSLFDFNEGFFDGETPMVVPDANITEDDKNFRIEIAVPGLDKKDIQVEVKEGVINIRAEKQDEKKEEDKNYRRREFSYSSFSRSFSLPENIATDKIDAKYENGVLHLQLPKKEMAVTNAVKQIEVA